MGAKPHPVLAKADLGLYTSFTGPCGACPGDQQHQGHPSVPCFSPLADHPRPPPHASGAAPTPPADDDRSLSASSSPVPQDLPGSPEQSGLLGVSLVLARFRLRVNVTCQFWEGRQ